MPTDYVKPHVEQVPGRAAKVLMVGMRGPMQQALTKLVSQQPDIEVCGSVPDLIDASCRIKSNDVEVIVVEWPVSDPNQTRVLQQLRVTRPELKWLAISLYDDHFAVKQAFDLGICGYITKAMTAETICAAIRAVKAGQRFCSPDVVDALPVEDHS